jgi:hypothetical protein
VTAQRTFRERIIIQKQKKHPDTRPGMLSSRDLLIGEYYTISLLPARKEDKEARKHPDR